MYLKQYQFNAVKGNLAYPGLITISGKRESSKLCHVIGLIECIPSKPMKSEESEKHWYGGAEDKTSRRDKTRHFSFDSGDVVEMVMNSLLCYGLITEPNVLKLRKKMLYLP